MTVSNDNWITIFDEEQNKLLKGYPSFFQERLNLFGIDCNLSSQNKYIGKTLITLLLRCSIKGCSRKYHLKTNRFNTTCLIFHVDCIVDLIDDNGDSADTDTDTETDTELCSIF